MNAPPSGLERGPCHSATPQATPAIRPLPHWVRRGGCNRFDRGTRSLAARIALGVGPGEFLGALVLALASQPSMLSLRREYGCPVTPRFRSSSSADVTRAQTATVSSPASLGETPLS
ncbi:hypothetical protein NDU88_007151 [Pleurodeles waltl]|uniref:Uncharacterized protein n=1 Tax=Pleurodeles waltl TaxID=8319 RepID=A0AAV7UN17_PLEWA|nr:hypothetical protein NDU88_007151 [Pleurodeles waltl]